LLRSGFIRAAAAARAKNYRYALVFIQRPRQIRRSRALVVGMRHNKENVHFVALIRRRQGLRLLRNAGEGG